MDFIKRNLAKLLLSAAMLAALAFAFVLVLNAFGVRGAEGFSAADAEIKSGTNATLFVGIAIIIGAIGTLAVAVMGMLDKDNLAPIILISAGLIAVILFVVGMAVGADALKTMTDSIKVMKDAKMTDTLNYKALVMQYNSTVFRNIFFLISFGCVPTIFGLKKLLER